ncbi:predicted protein [Histoplasma capsulatum H143]|uniref:Uncharacterized protein n=1 Tax=Ajellomyces capsulatus (strain H143) TaxID=544712 RepID=C6HSR1_AJECH|nr:predicted protein [Histoplasma capsulatum H143]
MQAESERERSLQPGLSVSALEDSDNTGEGEGETEGEQERERLTEDGETRDARQESIEHQPQKSNSSTPRAAMRGIISPIPWQCRQKYNTGDDTQQRRNLGKAWAGDRWDRR